MTKEIISVTAGWRQAFPGAHLGLLAMEGLANPAAHGELAVRKQALEEELRARYGGLAKAELRQLSPLKEYEAYYRRWDKSYHVLAQLESVASKGRSIPSVAALVEAMFTAELKNMLLTAGHDLACISGQLSLIAAAGDEIYTGLSGRELSTKAGDMMITDAEGPISSVLYGPDQRTSIRSETVAALFTVYAPAGIGEASIYGHLRDIEALAGLVSPAAVTRLMTVL